MPHAVCSRLRGEILTCVDHMLSRPVIISVVNGQLQIDTLVLADQEIFIYINSMQTRKAVKMTCQDRMR